MSNPVVIITNRDGIIVRNKPNFTSYAFNSEVFSLADSFELVLSDNTFDTRDWYSVQLRVNNATIFTGTIQRNNRTYSPSDQEKIVSGKDRGKFLDESFCSAFKDYENKSPEFIVNALIDQTQFYSQGVDNYIKVIGEPNWDNDSDIAEFNTAIINDIKNNKAFLKSENRTTFDSNFTSLSNKSEFKIEPGDMVGDRLVDLIRSVGMDIFYRQDGSLFIGDLDKLRNETSKKHTITLLKPDKGNNVLDGDVTDDNSNQYSDITVVSQNQNGVNTSSTAVNNSVVDRRTMIVPLNDDTISSKQEAIRIRNDQLIESLSATYTASGHVDIDSGDPWTLNRNTRVNDRVNNLVDDLVLYSVTYTFDSEGEGYKTTLGISHQRDPRRII